MGMELEPRFHVLELDQTGATEARFVSDEVIDSFTASTASP